MSFHRNLLTALNNLMYSQIPSEILRNDLSRPIPNTSVQAKKKKKNQHKNTEQKSTKDLHSRLSVNLVKFNSAVLHGLKFQTRCDHVWSSQLIINKGHFLLAQRSCSRLLLLRWLQISFYFMAHLYSFAPNPFFILFFSLSLIYS